MAGGRVPTESTMKTVPMDREPGTPADRILDILQELEAASSSSVVVVIIDTFLDSVPKQMAAIRRAVETNDIGAVKTGAHTLRGGSGTLGAMRLAALCSRLEEYCERGSLVGAATLLVTMEAEFDRVCEVLHEARAGVSA